MKIKLDLCWKVINDNEDIFNFRVGDKVEVGVVNSFNELESIRGVISSLSKSYMHLEDPENKYLPKKFKINIVRHITHVK